MKHYSTLIGLAITLLSQNALSQETCDLGAGFLYETDANGETTFTAFSSGGTNVTYEWTINGIGYGSDPEIMENVAPGDVVCVKAYSYVYEGEELVGFCYDLYCETICIPGGFVYTNNVLDEMILSAYSFGNPNVTYEWTINGVGYGSDPEFEVELEPGDVVCLTVYAYVYEGEELVELCSHTYCRTITAERAAGSVSPVKVYPNPARTAVSVDTEKGTVEILDMNGRVLLHGNTTKNIDVSGLVQGVYYIRIMDPVAGSGTTEKFIKE